ncbi:sensor histidine kinase [Paenibacillus urinalis]|uniref:Sensor histidine kinase n=1 Tax=Paenibacillus urinalis TaxID=521520 RepID=A0AAX3N599_9BACL|nr:MULTISPECIES: sensor histidine kinase [Paenibacillus]WDH84853.1 sensor histidine kinase [Paenibacillus urinalis]WDH96313.1 sensor histidine kinase [Paenibacillus urinalis]WDI04536.1 sensor histidine kinase [Paenibacillus urinalis]GAK42765.1 signal transduction protein [Paenibacillus sp. TCA20]
MFRKFRVRSIVNDIPLNYKFMLIFVIGILLPIFASYYLFMDRMSELIKEREEQNLQISMERARKDIHTMIDGGIAVSHALITDKVLSESIDRGYNGQSEFYNTFDDLLRHRVTSYIPTNNQIQRIGIYTDNPTIVSGGDYYVLNSTMHASNWYKQWKATGESLKVLAYRDQAMNNRAATSSYLSIIEKMDYYYAYRSYQKLVRIDFYLNRFYDVIAREKSSLEMYLVNDKNQIIVSADDKYHGEVDSQYELFDMNKVEDQDIHIVPIGSASYIKGWKLIGVPQETRVKEAMLSMQLYFGMLAGIITLITSIFIYIMLRSYNHRVKRLSRHMQKVGNEKFELINIDGGQDEIGHLITNFNMMTAQIKSLINNVYKLEIQQRSQEAERIRAELNMLQSQMNPHFLFNTLNALLVVSTKNNYVDVKDIIKDLSKLLRRLLNWKDDVVTLEEEMSFTIMYLGIEKFRFRDKFEYDIEITDEARFYKIPKMSIQQLAENACKHGIQAIEGTGSVKIRADIVDKHLRIVVSDNGKGMDKERLKEVQCQIRSQEESGGYNIGMRNVYRRLELYYDNQVKFNLKSKIEEGTEVSFEIPLQLLERQGEEGGMDSGI